MNRTARTPIAAFLAAALLAAAAPAAQPQDLRNLLTRPERTEYRETSTHADVVEFMQTVAAASPLIHYTTFGKTHEERDLPLAIVGALEEFTPEAVHASGKLRVFLQGNIHSGEVEGKEALQILLRELGLGYHAEWLDTMVLLVAPIYNADGNERLRPTNRGRQHGPVAGMGTRPNAMGLNLNRDYMKADAPETKAHLELLNRFDPQILMDLHTTNGTQHAYYLTYAGPLHPNTAPAIDNFLRQEWFPHVTRILKDKWDWDYFHYGNVSGQGENRRWATFEHTPRFSNNYWGLRNRWGILSEAYSYATFPDRILATRRFVEEILNYAHRNTEPIRTIIQEADRASIVGQELAVRARLARANPERVEILMGATRQVPNPVTGGTMLERTDVRRPELLWDYTAFEASETTRAPRYYLIPPHLTEALEALRRHGVELRPLERELTLTVEEFRIESSTLGERPFEGHRIRTLAGAYEERTRTFPAGTLVVPVEQPLGRLAFKLIEPRSDDGLATWNFVDAHLEGAAHYPIARTLAEIPGG